MTTSVFFSIIIPCLNEENFLPRLLNSLKKQRTNNFEVIIVDGGSEDGTLKSIRPFKDILPIRIIEAKKKNVSHQRNCGAKIAKGKYLIFIDADSKILPAFTKNLEKTIIKEHGLVFIPCIIPENKSTQTELLYNFINFLIEISPTIGKPFSSGGCIIIECKFFLFIEGFAEDLYMAEDHELIQKAYRWGVRAKFLRSIKVTFSLRRMKREGELKLFYKYLIASAHVLLRGGIKKKLFEYEMGGQFYLNKEKKMTREEQLLHYLQQAKDFFKQVF